MKTSAKYFGLAGEP